MITCTHAARLRTDTGSVVCVLCQAQLFTAPPAVGLTPGASWTRNGSWWYWRYPRADLDVTGRVFDTGAWVVLVEEEEIFHSKVPARSLGTAGRQCWRAMMRASTWNAPQVWRDECALIHLGDALKETR